jgi:hypothetical protein
MEENNMPNIKIYGFIESIDSMDERIKAGKLSGEIADLFKNESYAKDVVITTIPSKVLDLEGKQQPYIQLELNCMRGYKKKLEKLKTLGMDIQVVKLYDFIPKG